LSLFKSSTQQLIKITMMKEIREASEFLTRLLPKSIHQDVRASFSRHLTLSMEKRFTGHWYIGSPQRGSGFRAITSYHGRIDTVITDAATKSGLKDIVRLMPIELTLWVDPKSVSYRMGDTGSIGVVYDESEEKVEEKEEKVRESKAIRITAAPSPASGPRSPRPKRGGKNHGHRQAVSIVAN
jgi:protein Tob/BTG